MNALNVRGYIKAPYDKNEYLISNMAPYYGANSHEIFNPCFEIGFENMMS